MLFSIGYENDAVPSMTIDNIIRKFYINILKSLIAERLMHYTYHLSDAINENLITNKN